MERKLLLKRVFVFEDLEDNLIDNLSEKLKRREMKAGETVFNENEPAESFYIIDSGKVTISKHLGAEKEKTLSVLGPGNVFGEMAFFSSSPRTATAITNAESKLWEIKREDFMHFVSDQPKAGLKILSALLRVAMDRLELTSRELVTIYHAGKIISSGKKLDEISGEIKDELLLAIPEAEDAAIFLYNQFNEEFDPVSAPDKSKTLSKNNLLLEIAQKNISGAIIGKCESKTGLEYLDNCKSIIIGGIFKESNMLGLIILWNSKKENAFKSSQALLISSVGSQFAEAIENIKHQQEEFDKQRLDQGKQFT